MDDAKPTPKHHPECDGHFLLVFALGIPKKSSKFIPDVTRIQSSVVVSRMLLLSTIIQR